MTIEISTAIIISVLSLGFSVFMGLKSNKRTDNTDLEERVRENTRINMKLDESVKSAHHRIDGIETRLNDDKEV